MYAQLQALPRLFLALTIEQGETTQLWGIPCIVSSKVDITDCITQYIFFSALEVALPRATAPGWISFSKLILGAV